ncbi:MAG: S41 family peptidase [Prevotellaceae bacterium]|jgi:carboxyl-terminal processing protease|nr:S41 family peptidase [Prevotellaceae bacterium]
MNKKMILSILAVCCLFGNVFAQKQPSDRSFEISKNLDIYNSVFRELDLFYVDSINPKKLITESINDMLESLDPYTNYIPEEETKDLKFMTTGEYAGIGSIISQNKNKDIYIAEPYEGMPADKAGLRAGDIIREVDGVKTKDKSVSDVSDLLKGTQGTSVKVTLERPYEKNPVQKTIVRDKIQINPVSYYGVMDNNVGYILLNQFTDKATDEVKAAILDLKNKHQITSLVLDLRSNPGGLLDQAVSITNLFIPSGLEILTTRGKVKQWDASYKTTEKPLLPDMPLVVLINGMSASASEIVSGALQDLDRAVIVGARSYGKGLVQATREVSYNGHLKVTTAKYYTPSGRCIQAIDYAHRDDSGNITRIPDSLTNEFKTRAGRSVKDGGGITPDVEVKNEQKMNVSYYLYNQNMIFDYATKYTAANKKIASPEEFSVSDADYADFKAFLKEKDFTYTLKSAEFLKRLKEMAEYEGYGEMAKDEFEALNKKLTADTDRDLELFKKDIEDLLNSEIIKRYYYQKGAIRYNLKNDPELTKAIEILGDKTQYDEILKPKK